MNNQIKLIHVIETAFEPDDAIAIAIHASQCEMLHKIHKDNKDDKCYSIELYVVVGEGQPYKKMQDVSDFICELKLAYPNAYKSTKIIQGLGSTKEYPYRESSENATHWNNNPGEIVLSEYLEIYTQQPHLVLMMKPPREAMKLKIICPNTVVYMSQTKWSKHFFSQFQVKEIQDFFNSFKKIYNYDSYTDIEDSSGQFDDILNKVKLTYFLKNLIYRWNTEVIKNCEKVLVNENDSGACYAYSKIIKDITATGICHYFTKKSVNLLCLEHPNKPVELTVISNSEFVWKPSENSNIFVFESTISSNNHPLTIAERKQHRQQQLTDNLNTFEKTSYVSIIPWNDEISVPAAALNPSHNLKDEKSDSVEEQEYLSQIPKIEEIRQKQRKYWIKNISEHIELYLKKSATVEVIYDGAKSEIGFYFKLLRKVGYKVIKVKKPSGTVIFRISIEPDVVKASDLT